MTYTIQRDNPERDLEAVRDAIRQSPLTVEVYETLVGLADSIEEQVKPAIEEPLEFGSIVRAGFPGQPKATTNPLWHRSPTYGEHYWESEYKDVEVWPELTDVEVLRVGLGERMDVAPEHTEDYRAGVGDTVYKLHGRLQLMYAEAIGAERKNAIERMIQAVEELAP